MKKKAFGLIFGVLVAVLSLVVCLPKSFSYAANDDTSKAAHFLIDGEDAYLSSLEVGKSSGYNEYLLGEDETKIQPIEATANQGFKIVGWRLTFGGVDTTKYQITRKIDEQTISDNSAVIKTQTFTVDYIADEGSFAVEYTMSFESRNSNGQYFDYSTIKPNGIVENVTVDPVFDFVYSNLDVTDVIELTDIKSSYQQLNIETGKTLLFEAEETVEDVTKYTNSYLFEDGKYFYFGEVFKDNTTNEIYTLNTKYLIQGAEKTQKVLISVGRYRLGEEVDFGFDIAIDENVEQGKSVDITSLALTADDNASELNQSSTDGYVVTRDRYNRSKHVDVKFDTKQGKTLVSSLTVDYDQLFVVLIKANVPNKETIDDEDLIFESLTIGEHSYFSQIEKNKKYFVKDPTKKSNIYGFKLVAANTISNDGYKYYNFESISCDQSLASCVAGNMFDLKQTISQNFELTLNYSPVLYEIDFKFVLFDSLNNKFSSISGDFNVEQTLKLERGLSSVVAKTSVSNNVGYNFVGFVCEDDCNDLMILDGVTPSSELTVGIDKTKPENKLVYMLFVENEYTIKFNNLNKETLLTEENVEIYPIAGVNLSLDRNQTLSSFSLSNLGSKNVSASFSGTFKINDIITIVVTANKGFLIKGIGFAADQFASSTNTISFVLNKEFLSSYDLSNLTTIDMFVKEDFERFSLTYTLNSSSIDETNKTLMADLSIEFNGTVYNKDNIQDIENISYTEIENEKIQIVISNLKMYDVVNLISNPKKLSNEEDAGYYLFNRYTENFQTNLTLAIDNPPTYKCVVKYDIEIFAIYSLPGLWLNMNIDNPLAYDLTREAQDESSLDYVVDTDGEMIAFDAKNMRFATELKPAQHYVLHLNSSFNFGYELVAYDYNGNQISASTLANPYIFEFDTNATTEPHTIQIITREIPYVLNVSYAYSLDETPTELGSYTLNMSNLKLIVTPTEGYFVSAVYFVTSNGRKEYAAAKCDNSYSSEFYTYTFTGDELSGIVGNYGKNVDGVVNVDMLLVYTLHTYSVTVRYGLVVSKGEVFDGRVSFPNITMTANGEKVYYNDLNTTRTFNNIPYGAVVILTAEAKYEDGMSPSGWIYDKISGITGNLTSLTVSKITSNHNFEYKLNYNSYSINICMEGKTNTSDPIVVIRDCQSEEVLKKISRFDKLTINMNADKQSGIRFVNMYYFKLVPYTGGQEGFKDKTLYVRADGKYSENSQPYDENIEYYEKVRVDYSAFEPYNYDQTTWANDWNKLYYIFENGFKRNTSSEYANIQYYKYSNTKFEDTDFQAGKYFAEVNSSGGYSITFYVEYDNIEIALNLNASISGIASLELGDLAIKPIEYATLTYNKIDSSNNVTALSSGETISIQDYKIRITINLNTFNIDNVDYSLSAGVVLRRAYIYDSTNGVLQLENKGYGVYETEFFIGDLLLKNCLSDYDIFNLYLEYRVENKKMMLTTNISASEFYQDGGGNTIFSMSNDQLRYGFGAGSTSSRGSTTLTVDFQYLGKVFVSYAFITPYQEYNQYFNITNIQIYQLKQIEDIYGFISYGKGDKIATTTLSDLQKYGLTNISTTNKCFDYRFTDNIYIELQVQPVVKINASNNQFEFVYSCDASGNGQQQSLTVGQTSTSNIEIASVLQGYLKLAYYKEILDNGVSVGFNNVETTPIDAGKYKVELNFEGTGAWSWLSDLKFEEDIFVIITPKELELKVNTEIFNRKQSYEKTYDGKNSYVFNNAVDLLNYVYFTDGVRNYAYSSSNQNFILQQTGLQALISYTNGDTQVYTGKATSNGQLLNLHLSGLKMLSTNFTLKTDNLVFENAIKINPREITLIGVKVYDKVDDGTDKAEFKAEDGLRWLNLIAGDLVDNPDPRNLVLRFEKNAYGKVEVGYNKNIIIDAAQVLRGEDASNYTIKVDGTTASIYPYKVSATVDGFGEIEVRNDKGLINTSAGTNHDLANLIPIGAKLKVDVIYADSPEYVAIYPNLSNYINKNHNFVVGYRLTFETNNVSTKLSNNLTLVLPNADRLTNVLLLLKNGSVGMQYTEQGDKIILDLSQTNYEISQFALIQQRVLLQPWQLILIISLAALLLAVVIIVLIVVRKRKLQHYSINEKI